MRGLVKCISISFAISFLASCGGGGGSSDTATQQNPAPSPVLNIGLFIDSPVEGLSYTTATRSGLTNSQGEFEYLTGETVTFSLGGITLGQSTGSSVVTPVNLITGATDHNHPYVVNILRLLQSFDEDNDPSNGITLSPSLLLAAESLNLDVQVPVTDFESNLELTSFIQANTSRSALVDTSDALQHFQIELAGIQNQVVHSIGGSISGLTGDISLSNNSNEIRAFYSNGSFVFFDMLDEGAAYNVLVSTQPNDQFCIIQNGSGVANENVTGISVICQDLEEVYTVSGTVLGMSPINVNRDLVLLNNGSNATTITSNGVFSFDQPVFGSAGYNVTVLSQRSGQTCSVINGTSSIIGQDITNVSIVCTDNMYTVSATVSGLNSNSITLQNNGTNLTTRNTNGGFTFSIPVAELTGYNVTVQTQPAGQICTITNNSSPTITQDVSNILISCTDNAYSVSGTVSGLANGLSLVLLNNGGNSETIIDNGVFSFNTVVSELTGYNVSIQTQPTGQICQISNGSSSTITQNISNVIVSCSDITYTIGGSVTGLANNQTVVLTNNGSDAETVSIDGGFTFNTPVSGLTGYNVAVQVQPEGQTCTVTSGSAASMTQNINSVIVNCTDNTYMVSGSISGLNVGETLELHNHGVLVQTLSANDASYNFTTTELDGYNLSLVNTPASKTCSIANSSAIPLTQNASNANISCIENGFIVSGSVSGLELAETLELHNHGVLVQTLSASDASYSFTTTELTGYTLSLVNGPTGKTCSVVNNSSVPLTQNITDANISCTVNNFTVSGSVSGLESTETLELYNHGVLVQTLSADDASYNFTTTELTGYTLSLVNGPSDKTCSVANNSSVPLTQNIIDANINCVMNYTISGSVKGLHGSVVLQNNGGDDLSISADSSLVYTSPFSFSAKVSHGGQYDVSVLSQPSGTLNCTVTKGNAVNIISDINDVNVECSDRVLISNVVIDDINLRNCIDAATVGMTYADELKALNCSSMSIEYVNGLGSFTGLEWLDISNNSILFIDSLYTLVNLEYLNDSGNPIALIQSVADMMKAGGSYWLGLCVQRHIKPGTVERLDQLTELDCSRSGPYTFSSDDPITRLDHIGTLRYLKKLNLSGHPNLFLTSYPEDNPPFYDFDYSRLQKLTIHPVLSPSPLEVLNLKGTGLDALHWVEAFPNLKNLNVSDNHVTDLSPLSRVPLKVVEGGFERDPALDLFDYLPNYTLEVKSPGDVSISLVPDGSTNYGDVFFDVYNEAGIRLGGRSYVYGYPSLSPVSLNLTEGIYSIVVNSDHFVNPFDFSLNVDNDQVNGTPGDAVFVLPLKYLGISPCNGCLLYSDVSPLSSLGNLRHIDIRNNTAISDVSSWAALSQLTNVGIANTNIDPLQLPVNVDSILTAQFVSDTEIQINEGETKTSSLAVNGQDIVGVTGSTVLLTFNIDLGSDASPYDIDVTLIDPNGVRDSIYLEFNCETFVHGVQISCTNIDAYPTFISSGEWFLEVSNNTTNNYGELDAVLTGWSIEFDNGVVKSSNGLGLYIDSNSNTYRFSMDEYMITGEGFSSATPSITTDFPVIGDLSVSIDTIYSDYGLYITNYSEPNAYGVIDQYIVDFEY